MPANFLVRLKRFSAHFVHTGCAAFLLILFAAPIEANTSAAASSGDIDAQALAAFLKENVTGKYALGDRYDAEVWVFNMLDRMKIYAVPDSESLKILQAVYRESNNSALEPDIVLAVIAIESSFNRYAVSTAGAQGLMQIMPFWKDEIGRPGDNLMDIDTNIQYGCKILQFYLQREDGNLSRALARYNGSVGRTVYPEKVLLSWERRWRSGRL